MNNALTNIIQNEQAHDYPLFKDYCLLKEKGLRKQSFKSLNLFIDEVKTWNTTKQQHFVFWLFGLFEISSDISDVLVHPLEEKLLKPLLEEWLDVSPKDAKLYRWYALFLNTEKTIDYLKLALKFGGQKEQLALLELIHTYLYSLWYSSHHISEDLYLGDVDEDKRLIKKIENLTKKIENEQDRQHLYEELMYHKNLLNDWIAFKNESSEGFVQWCTKNGKEYEWIAPFYYD